MNSACQEWQDASVEFPISLNPGTRNALHRKQCFSTYKLLSIMQNGSFLINWCSQTTPTALRYLPEQTVFDRQRCFKHPLPAGTKAQRAGTLLILCSWASTPARSRSGVCSNKGEHMEKSPLLRMSNCCIPRKICVWFL